MLQDMGRQLVTFGLHVHVGVDSGDKAVMICDRIMRHLPTLLALSCNSPWWDNRVTGLHSHRSKIMESLPTAGLPPLMRNWSEYVWLVNHLIETGFITTIRDIWWDVRPHHNFGTVEVRVCDMPGSLDDVLAITALIQCLVYGLSEEIDGGTYQHDHHPMMVRQNKWRRGAVRPGRRAGRFRHVSVARGPKGRGPPGQPAARAGKGVGLPGVLGARRENGRRPHLGRPPTGLPAGNRQPAGSRAAIECGIAD